MIGITYFFNPNLSERRLELYENFSKHMKDYGLDLYTIELSYNGKFQVTKATNKKHIRVQTNSIMWPKENLIDVALSKIPETKYVTWLDSDIEFLNSNWIDDTIKKLETDSCVLQPYSISKWESESKDKYEKVSMSYAYENRYVYEKTIAGIELFRFNQKIQSLNNEYKSMASPGLAWAARMDFMNAIGGMMKRIVFRSGDLMIANAIYNKEFPAFYKNKQIESFYVDYQTKIRKYILETNRKPSFVEGELLHHYHGSVRERNNFKHFQLFNDANLDFVSGLVENKYGIYEFSNPMDDDFIKRVQSAI